MTGEERNVGRDVARLERAVERLTERVGRIERTMWIMTGLGGATVCTAIYNLMQNVQQSGGM